MRPHPSGTARRPRPMFFVSKALRHLAAASRAFGIRGTEPPGPAKPRLCLQAEAGRVIVQSLNMLDAPPLLLSGWVT